MSEIAAENLPLSGSRNISYLYDAAGSKLYRETSSGSGTDKHYYVNGAEYDTNGELLFIRTFFGRLVPNGSGGFTYEYFIKDHLGNIRGIYADRNGNHLLDGGEVTDVADYYAFGRKLDYGSTYAATPLNHYGFGEKEQQPMTEYLDFHARQYDATIGRWLSVDPLAEKAVNWTPYRYGFNNPITFIDPTGLWEETDGGYTTNKQEDIGRFMIMLQMESSKNNEHPGFSQLSSFARDEMEGRLGTLSDGSTLAKGYTITRQRDAYGASSG